MHASLGFIIVKVWCHRIGGQYLHCAAVVCFNMSCYHYMVCVAST